MIFINKNPNLTIDKGGSQQTGLDAKWKHPNDGSSALQPSATDSKMDFDAGVSNSFKKRMDSKTSASNNSPEFNLESCNSQAPKISQQGAVTRAEILGEVSGSQDNNQENNRKDWSTMSAPDTQSPQTKPNGQVREELMNNSSSTRHKTVGHPHNTPYLHGQGETKIGGINFDKDCAVREVSHTEGADTNYTLEEWIKDSDLDGRGILFQFTDSDIPILRDCVRQKIEEVKINQINSNTNICANCEHTKGKHYENGCSHCDMCKGYIEQGVKE